MPSAESIRIATDYLSRNARAALTESQAKLYSQSVRRQMGREGLATFGTPDIQRAMDEAFLLVQYALLNRNGAAEASWRDAVKRAAEILEWLSQADLRPTGTPLHLLSAAAYQVAGYPAMALGELKQLPENDEASAILAGFLRADFPAVLRAIHEYWQQEITAAGAVTGDGAEFSAIAIQHVIRCIGTICGYLRFGQDDMVERATNKLDRLASGFLHSRDSYSALLAKLVAAVGRNYVDMSLWRGLSEMQREVASDTNNALVQFARAQFVNRRSLIWPAQAAGISRLREGNSFALCTPTGSGKTTVATLGIIPALFEPNPNVIEGLEDWRTGNLVLYLVPSRALAAEVEQRLDQDLRGLSAQRIVVTGLYGGTDWGPTDAWISQDQPTILICTFEKADALLRFLGVLFLNRVRLVVIDEAHMVNYGKPDPEALQNGSNRAYRLEMLGTRLSLAREVYSFRVIALSAVAAAAGPSLARWVSGNDDAVPTESSHRSTRQMLGRLEVSAQGSFTIRYDLMNSQSLQFREGRTTSSPYIGEPFPRLPERLGPRSQPEVRMRAPTLWAALNLASERTDGTKPTVLISIAQSIDSFSETCINLLDGWQSVTLPSYFEAERDNVLLSECLGSMADYFSEQSFEYRLLARRIAVHHGKLPAPIARRLKRLIDSGTVRVIIATSTLSEGVNIPVNYILIPSVFRGQTPFELQEFGNLIGRAGRPGVATEGHALVVLAEDHGSDRQRVGYVNLRNAIQESASAAPETEDSTESALIALISSIESSWRAITGGGTDAAFERWLRETVVTAAPETAAIRNLDALDYFLLSALGEVEELRNAELGDVEIEGELQRIWRATYAHASAVEEEHLSTIWLNRGRAIPTLYPDRQERVRLYKTSLTPRSARVLLDRAPAIVETLQTGVAYGRWSTEERFQYIVDVISLLNEVPSFRLGTVLGRKKNFTDWPMLLRWWMCKWTLEEQPTPKQITVWFDYVSKNFAYRSSWGLGGVIAVVLNEDQENPINPLDIDEWPRAGLPWVAFWLKELFTWGTLEPVAAFLLARGDAKTRFEAERDALPYYESRPPDTDTNDLLDPRLIRAWAQEIRIREDAAPQQPNFDQRVRLVREASRYAYETIHVAPVVINGRWTWIDKAGYAVAEGPILRDFQLRTELYEFVLNVRERTITGRPYLAHR